MHRPLSAQIFRRHDSLNAISVKDSESQPHIRSNESGAPSAYGQYILREKSTAQALRSAIPQKPDQDDFLSDQQLAVKYAMQAGSQEYSRYNPEQLLEAADEAALQEAIRRSLCSSDEASVDSERNELKTNSVLQKTTIESLLSQPPAPISAHLDRWHGFLGSLEQEKGSMMDGAGEHQNISAQHNPALSNTSLVPKLDSSSLSSANEQKFEKAHLSSEFRVMPNQGGGDCLFHSLHKQDLKREELLAFRKNIASQRLEMKENPGANALQVAQGLAQSLGRGIAEGLMQGRHEISNESYAAFQAIPGMYAGDDELIQWCKLKRQSVAVIDIPNNSLSLYSAQGCKKETALTAGCAWQDNLLKPHIAKTGFALLRTADHWERIELQQA